MRLVLIANPDSGGGTDADALAARLRALGADVTVHHRCELEGVRPASPERLVAAGGDGTIAIAADVAGTLDIPLAVIPAGTANDFARGQGIPEDVDAASELAVAGRHTRPLDLGRLTDGTPFVNVASAGLASAAAKHAVPFKTVLGPLAYGVGAIRAAVTATPHSVSILTDSEPLFHGDAWQVIVAVTGTFGGGSHLDEADPQDGMLDVAVVPAGSRAALAWRALGMRTGRLSEQDGVRSARACEVELHFASRADLNVDGELVRAGRPERIKLEPRAFSLVAPPPPHSDPRA